VPNITRSRATPIGITTTSVSEGERAEAFLPAGVEEEVDSEIEELFPAFVVIAELVDRILVEVLEVVEMVVEVMEEGLVSAEVLLELDELVELDEVDGVVDPDEDASDEAEVVTELVETVDGEEIVDELVEEEEDSDVVALVVEPDDDEVCVEPIAEKEYSALAWIQS
jgi:hypothetical protein